VTDNTNDRNKLLLDILGLSYRVETLQYDAKACVNREYEQ
jgi:hypothetical protein